jgi:hypothetical protein
VTATLIFQPRENARECALYMAIMNLLHACSWKLLKITLEALETHGWCRSAKKSNHLHYWKHILKNEQVQITMTCKTPFTTALRINKVGSRHHHLKRTQCASFKFLTPSFKKFFSWGSKILLSSPYKWWYWPPRLYAEYKQRFYENINPIETERISNPFKWVVGHDKYNRAADAT